MTLGNAAAARVRLIVWCRERGRQVEPDLAEMATPTGAELAVPACRERALRCSAPVDDVSDPVPDCRGNEQPK